MQKLIICAVIINILCSVCFAQDTKTLEVTGYGKSQEEALNDAYTYAVQMAVGTLISSSVYIANGALIDEKIIAHSEGYIVRSDVVKPYDGNSVTISADVQTKNLQNSLALYSQPIVNDQQVSEIEFDGSSYVAQYDTQQKMMQSRISALQKQGDIFFDELFSARNIYVESYTQGRPIQQGQQFQFDVTINQSVNDIRYSSTIARLGRLFVGVGAKVQEEDNTRTANPNKIASENAYTVVLVNIDGSVRAYTFDAETFKGLHRLFTKLISVENLQAAKISFMNSQNKSIQNIGYGLGASTYFFNSQYKDPGSFVITNNIINTRLTDSIVIDREILTQIKTLKAEYSREAIDRQIQIIDKRIDYDTQPKDSDNPVNTTIRKDTPKNYGYFDAVTLKLGYASVVEDSNVFRGIGIGAEYSHFPVNFPYLGFGMDASYSSGESDKKGNTATVIDFGLKGFARYPIKLFELYAAGGVSYALADSKIDNTKYNALFFNITAELGLNAIYKSFICGLRYKYYMPFTDSYKLMDKIEGSIGFSF